MRRRRGLILLLVLPVLAGGIALAYPRLRKKVRHHYHHHRQPAPVVVAKAPEPPAIDYAEQVKPLLRGRCVSCHGARRQSGGLRLDTLAAALKGGRHGPAIVAGVAEKSPLIGRLRAEEDERMPRDAPALTDPEIDLLVRWINAGAPGPLYETPPDYSADHWAFHAPSLPPVPPAPPDGSANTPIDCFLAATRQKQGLRAAPPLDRGRLLRRVALDLVGLPPTLEELRAFLADTAPDAYERAVDRLLASPRYGERWGRHWMDVWRYSDEDGRRNPDGKFKEINWGSTRQWHWRDWILAALNEDKGYDRMVLEMLAGDELAPGEGPALAATGFLVRNRCTLDRNLWLTTTVEHTAKGFLGLTLGCAQCHDHKYDPISQREYYQFRAFFEPHDVKETALCLAPGAEAVPVAHAYDARPDAPTYIFDRGNEHHPLTAVKILPGVPRVLQGAPLSVVPAAGGASTGRRLALARWLVDERNPLTARVAVNHVWARHFGKGLVETPSDFGRRARAPSHPELLDWLAVEFRRHGWSMKWLHRLIVTSAAYRMHSAAGPELAESARRDPENLLLWRMPSRRMEAEVVRDSVLFLAGRLGTALGGPNASHLEAETSTRRSLYFRTSREDKVEFLCQFDPANLDECYQRTVSVAPQQALALANSKLVWTGASRIAEQLPAEPTAFVQAAFLLALCRPPSPAEAGACARFVREQTVAPGGRLPGPAGPASVRAYLVHALLNHNDFITIR